MTMNKNALVIVTLIYINKITIKTKNSTYLSHETLETNLKLIRKAFQNTLNCEIPKH